MSVLHARSAAVGELIKALGLPEHSLQSVVLSIKIGQVVTIEAEYRQEIWVGDVKKAIEIFKKYELHEILP